ncbi:MAG: TrkH family potassium uptake protein [Candidatus Kapaibacteriales bacterium]
MIGLISLVAFLLIIGFKLYPWERLFVQEIIRIVIYTFIAQEILRLLIAKNILEFFITRWFELLLTAFLIFEIIFIGSLQEKTLSILPFFSFEEITLGYLLLSQMVIFLSGLIKMSRHISVITNLHLHPGAIFAISFAVAILIGTLLLLLPNATPDDKPLNLVDSLFTATSAICVTGLIVVDTSTNFTILGKVILLLLIQAGGLGIMTLTTFFATATGGGMTLRMRIMIKEFISSENLSAVGSLLFRIVLFTFTIELIGAIILFFSLNSNISQPDPNQVFNAIFHSISAFCNAGFSLYSDNLTHASLSSNYVFKFTISILIILGGIGFISLSELSSIKLFGKKAKKIKHQLSVSTKLAISTTVFLIALGTILLLIGDLGSGVLGQNLFENIFNAYFHSVSARTAGFNTVDIESISKFSAIILIVLMWIGASPGGTGGGVKTTTFSIATLYLINYIRGKERLEIFDRQIHEETIKRAFLVIFISGIVIFFSTSVLIIVEKNIDPLNLLFEVTSALGTVGLSRNVTFLLSDLSKLIIIIVMYVGRIGILTFLMAFFKQRKEANYSLPRTYVNVG